MTLQKETGVLNKMFQPRFGNTFSKSAIAREVGERRKVPKAFSFFEGGGGEESEQEFEISDHTDSSPPKRRNIRKRIIDHDNQRARARVVS